MRTIPMAWAAALAMTAAAAAQTPQTAQPPAPAAVETPARPWAGRVDFGVRGTSVDGDAARYERYRDLGDGLFGEVARLSGDRNGWLLDFDGEHVGRRDQRYIGEAVRPGRVKAAFMWDQIPMLLSRTTVTLYSGVGTGELQMDNALQAIGQANPAAMTTIFEQTATEFETSTRRHIADGAFEYLANRDLTFRANFRQTNREGTIPFGGSFGHSAMVELPAPTEHSLSEFEGNAEFARETFVLRGGYRGSWFHNDVTSLIFDNPFRAVDISSASSRGRLTLAPTNSYIAVNGLASVKLPYRSRASAYVSIGSLKDAGDPLVPPTINAAVVPAPIDRDTVEGETRTAAVNLTFVSRPVRPLDLNVRYRSYDYDNRTPEFALSQRISYDNAPAAVVPPVHTEPFGVVRHTFDADARLTVAGRSYAGLGYTRLAEERSHRIFESTTDNVVRLTFDTLGRQWFTLRTKYEHAARKGDGLDTSELVAIGEQPGMRHYDVADRDRDRLTILGAFTPAGNVTANASVAVGADDYNASEFGLRDNNHRVYSAGVDYLPGDRYGVGLSYSYERYFALSRSRQANPGDQFTDPSRNWASEGTDRVHSVIFTADVNDIGGKVDLTLAYDFNQARATYEYITGPVADRTLPEEVIVPSTLPTPTELPPTLSELHRVTADAVYPLTSRLSLGVSYWFEKYLVNDFTLGIDANPSLVRGQALLMGYLYQPYTAHTVWGRLIVAW